MIRGIGKQAAVEKPVLATRVNFLDQHGPQPGQTWRDVLPTSLGTQIFDLDTEGVAGGQQAGGINTVTEYDQLPGGFKGYNKTAEKEIRKGTPEEGISKDLAIPQDKPDMHLRALAMWRIDQLLGANILTRTEKTLANQRATNGVITESVANGAKFGARANQPGEFYATAAARGADPAAKPDAFTGDDPVLQRALSKLMIVDALCGQVDRHAGNVFIQTDGAGNVVGVVGIDNDLAFPEGPTPGVNRKPPKSWDDVTRALPRVSGRRDVLRLGDGRDGAVAQPGRSRSRGRHAALTGRDRSAAQPSRLVEGRDPDGEERRPLAHRRTSGAARSTPRAPVRTRRPVAT